MMASPPASPDGPRQRPQSALYRPPPRSNSRMSVSSKQGGGLAGSRASDEDARTSVKVGMFNVVPLSSCIGLAQQESNCVLQPSEFALHYSLVTRDST